MQREISCIRSKRSGTACLLPIRSNTAWKANGAKIPGTESSLRLSATRKSLPPTKEGVIAYLASGQIKGIGKKTAERIYDAFGQDTLLVLDQEPKKLLEIRGISEKKLTKILNSYLANRGARDVIAFLAPHGVFPNRAVKLYREYGEETMDMEVKENNQQTLMLQI